MDKLTSRTLTCLFASALAACGGGDEDSATNAAADQTAVAVADEAASDDSRASALATTITWTKVANEYARFTLSGQRTVRYGDGARWTSKALVAGTYTCNNALFGSDPAPGIDKQCQVQSTSTSPSPSPAPAPAPAAGYGNFKGASLGINANTNGAIAFPADNAWNKNIANAPKDPNSDAIIASMSPSTGLHSDFGSGTWEGAPIGIPYVIVSGSQPKVAVQFTAYGSESDPGPYPIPTNAPVEGGRQSSGDRHVLVIDRDNNRLYETANSYPMGSGAWQVSVGAVFNLSSNNVRPGGHPGWTSADAAGLPIFPGLVRYEEAVKGAGGIKHALRFTVPRTRRAYVPPATHWASSNTSPNLPPMGMRVRLRANYVIPSNASNESKAILTALKTYGMLLADNGSAWYLTGAPDQRWNNDKLRSELGAVKGSDFEVVRMDGMVTP